MYKESEEEGEGGRKEGGRTWKRKGILGGVCPGRDLSTLDVGMVWRLEGGWKHVFQAVIWILVE